MGGAEADNLIIIDSEFVIMPKIQILLASLVIALTPNIANAQYDDTPSGAGAWNTCWALEQGLPFAMAFKMSIDPMTALIDQRGAQPMQMKRNFMTIANFTETLKDLPEAEKDSRINGFVKNAMKKTLQMCPNSIGASEVQQIREYISK